MRHAIALLAAQLPRTALAAARARAELNRIDQTGRSRSGGDSAGGRGS